MGRSWFSCWRTLEEGLKNFCPSENNAVSTTNILLLNNDLMREKETKEGGGKAEDISSSCSVSWPAAPSGSERHVLCAGAEPLLEKEKGHVFE